MPETLEDECPPYTESSLGSDGTTTQPQGRMERRETACSEREAFKRRSEFVKVDYVGGVEATGPELDLFATEGYRVPGDSGTSQDKPPTWYDEDLFRLGQRTALDYHAGMGEAEMLALFLLFTLPNALDPLVSTGKSDTAETAGKRYLSTNLRFLSWFSSDPFDRESEAYRSLVAVRRMHAAVRKSCHDGSPEQLAVKFTVGKDEPRDLICPRRQFFKEAFSALPDGAYRGPCPVLSNLVPDNPPETLGVFQMHVDRYRRPFLSQGEMAMTQWTFFGMFIVKPEVFAAPNITRREIEALLHMWGVFGYCLGIEDRFNFALGGVNKVLRRSEVFIRSIAVPSLRTMDKETAPIWEHMSRCVVDGTAKHFGLTSFDGHLVYLAEDVLELGTILPKALSWRETLQLWRLRFFLQYLPRWWPSWSRVMSRGLQKLMKRSSLTGKTEA